MARPVFFMLFCLLLQAATPLLFVPDKAIPQIHWKGHSLAANKPVRCQLHRALWTHDLSCRWQNKDLMIVKDDNLFEAVRNELKSSPPEDPYFVSDFYLTTDGANAGQLQVNWSEINYKPDIEIFRQWTDSDGSTYCFFLVADTNRDHLQAELTSGPETLVFNSASPMPASSEETLKKLGLDQIPLPLKGMTGAVTRNDSNGTCVIVVQDGILHSRSKAQIATGKQQVNNELVSYLQKSLKNK